MPRGRGGVRQGTPGKGYANRTDLLTNRAPNTNNTAATGGVAAPAAPSTPHGVALPVQPSVYPEDSPMLSDPTQRPGEPVTAGLPMGPGPGPAESTRGLAAAEVGRFKPWLPLLEKHANSGDAAPSFVRMVRYLRDAPDA